MYDAVSYLKNRNMLSLIGFVGVQPHEVIERTQKCVEDKMLYRCLTCEALMEYHLSMEQFEKGGALYNLAVNTHKVLDPTKLYSFPTLGKFILFLEENHNKNICCQFMVCVF